MSVRKVVTSNFSSRILATLWRKGFEALLCTAWPEPRLSLASCGLRLHRTPRRVAEDVEVPCGLCRAGQGGRAQRSRVQCGAGNGKRNRRKRLVGDIALLSASRISRWNDTLGWLHAALAVHKVLQIHLYVNGPVLSFGSRHAAYGQIFASL